VSAMPHVGQKLARASSGISAPQAEQCAVRSVAIAMQLKGFPRQRPVTAPAVR
jgi:hypothetical protein